MILSSVVASNLHVDMETESSENSKCFKARHVYELQEEGETEISICLPNPTCQHKLSYNNVVKLIS